MDRTPAAIRTGTSLVEVMVSTMMVAVVLVAALNTAGSATRTARGRAEMGQGRRYAEELLAEIMAMPYCDPEENAPNGNWGIESDEPSPATNRLAFDDIDDYDDWTEGSALAWRDGAARMDTAGWSRNVVVGKLKKNRSDDTHVNDSVIDDGARLITVTVTSPTSETTVLQAIQSVDGAMEQPPTVDTTFVTGVLVELQTGTAAVSDGVAIINHASGP